MLCPSCGQNVGETLQLCDNCEEQKQLRDKQKKEEAEAKIEEEEVVEENVSQPQIDGLDSETRLLVVKAIAAALVVLVVLLILLLILS